MPDAESQHRLVRVRWDGPVSIQEVAKKQDPNDDCGLYQVYGTHAVFGPTSLLYIGMAMDQTFAKRSEQHARWLRYESDVSVRLGRIEKHDYEWEPKRWTDWKSVLGQVESLTIFWHSPPYNSQSIVQPKVIEPLRVQNWGDRGRLLPEYSWPWEPVTRPDGSGET